MPRTPPSLNDQLARFHNAMMERLPESDRAAIRLTHAVANALVLDHVPRVGDIAPDFTLPDQHDRLISLADRLSFGPVVLLFVRGGWCPFCTLTLRAYQEALPAIYQEGGDLLAITPQPSPSSCAVAERDLLAFPTLSDLGNTVARRYGIQTQIDPGMRPLHLRLGHDLPRINGTGDWTVPLPATFVIAPGGTVALAHVDRVNSRRLDPADIVQALHAIRTGALDPAMA